MADPVADFLTRVRNALIADHDDVLVPCSRFNRELARLLKEQGYVEDVSVEKMHPPRGRRRRRTRDEVEMVRIRLKYTEDRQSVISGLKRISKPGRREYVTADSLPRVLGGMGTAVMTTSKGVMTAYEAQRQGVGGEVVALVW